MQTRDLTPDEQEAWSIALALGCDVRDAFAYIERRRLLLSAAAEEQAFRDLISRTPGTPGQ